MNAKYAWPPHLERGISVGSEWTEVNVPLWSHKYNLFGLITYMRYTGNQNPLEACHKVADLICRTNGDAPGQITILSNPHHGLAHPSVMEPLVELHRITGEPRYSSFAATSCALGKPRGAPKSSSPCLPPNRLTRSPTA